MMTTRRFTAGLPLCFLAALALFAGLFPEPRTGYAEDSKAAPDTTKENERVPEAVARDRAKVMHEIYSATLDVMHHRYFHRERSVLPARAMEDIFAHIDRQSGMQARWIAVNTKAMSINHEPATPFEKQAAREIAAGKTSVDVIEDGYYRRAGAIPLDAGCVSCHGGFFKEASKTPRFAGLVISVPVLRDPAAPGK